MIPSVKSDIIELAKNFSAARIFSSSYHLYPNETIYPLLYTKYYALGVFLDLSCYEPDDVKELFTKVSLVV